MVAKILTTTLIVCVVLCSCSNKGNNNTEAAEEEAADSLVAVEDTLHLFEEVAPPVAADELFDDFFFNFVADTRYQNQRISFPLKVKDGNAEFVLTHEDWHKYNRFKAQEFYSVIYEREGDMELQKDTSISEVSVEWIYLKDEYIERFNFRRINGKWMLTDIGKDETKKTPNGSFLHFYSQFVTDSVFQSESIVEPLKFVITSEDGEDMSETDEITVEEWFQMQSDMPIVNETLVNINYGQTCISQNRKNVLMKGVSNGLLMNFRFDKTGGKWKLIEIEN